VQPEAIRNPTAVLIGPSHPKRSDERVIQGSAVQRFFSTALNFPKREFLDLARCSGVCRLMRIGGKDLLSGMNSLRLFVLHTENSLQ
jgi:hypothetical protein